MKRFIACTIILFFSFNCIAQLQKMDLAKSVTIGKIKMGFTILAELSYIVQGNDTTCNLTYSDLMFTQINVFGDVSFSGGSVVVDGLYTLLMDAIAAEKGKETMFKLGKTNVIVKTNKSLGSKSLRLFIEKPSGSLGQFVLNKSQINKLFNREEKEQEVDNNNPTNQ